MPEFPHVQKAADYARGVVGGTILACKWVRLACARHLRDLERAKTDASPYRFDAEKAERRCKFLELLPHVKGKWARRDPKTKRGQRIVLEPWQCFVIASIFGWLKKENGMRRFRKVSIYVPRKNAKSTLAAGIGWLMFGKDDEPGAEVYSGATTEKQAWEVFGTARQMGVVEPKLPDALGVTMNAASMVRLKDNAKFEPIIGKPGDGSSPHCAIIDEYHEHDTSVSYDTMLTGMGAREQPLILVISTAGSNLAGPCREDWKTVEKILDGVITDETHFGIIWTVDDGEKEWMTEAGLQKANPNFGVSVGRDFLLDQLATAMRDARQQGTFKTKHLNLWVTAKSGYFNVQKWQSLADPNLKRDAFRGRGCYLSGDFASKHDLNAMMQLVPIEAGEGHERQRYAVFGRYYLPRSTVDLPENQHYRAWAAAGYITVTDGNVIDMTAMVDDAEKVSSDHGIIEMPIDPNRAWGVSAQLQGRGIPVVEYRNTVLTMSEPMKELDKLIRAGRIVHDGDPVLAWAISNVVAQEDKKENVYPNKESAAQKIDPVVALIMMMGRAMVGAGGKRSIYEDDGIFSV